MVRWDSGESRESVAQQLVRACRCHLGGARGEAVGVLTRYAHKHQVPILDKIDICAESSTYPLGRLDVESVLLWRISAITGQV